MVAALQASKFDDAARQAIAVLATDPGNARAAAVRAIAGYIAAADHGFADLDRLVKHAEDFRVIDSPEMRKLGQTFLDQLAAVDRDLAVVAGDPGFALDLCLACWQHDWNHSGEIDRRDARVFELEDDGKGGEFPEGDPRRRPTFRFDVGDADWARAMISFQRALGELVMAYQWSTLGEAFAGHDQGPVVTIKLLDKARVTRARELILAGLAAADRSRAAYLAEIDDDREWLPSPRQQHHPLPFPVDDALYQTWAGVIGDVRGMLESRDGLSIKQAAVLIHGPVAAAVFPDAYVDFGKLLAEPHDFVIDFGVINGKGPAAIDSFLRGVLQSGYRTGMHASPLVQRLARMKADFEHGADTVEHKLRYLLWLN